MDSLTEVVSSLSQNTPSAISGKYNPKSETDALVIEATLGAADESDTADEVDTGFAELYKGLSVSARKVIDKLNELLKAELPDGIQSLAPEEVTSEATAERIVSGATSFFNVFAKQNPNLEGEDLLNKFMETIRGGIQKGYDEASSILEDIGAFKFDGVKESIEETKTLVEEKLQAFEAYMREQMGLAPKTAAAAESAAVTQNAILQQSGANVLNITA